MANSLITPTMLTRETLRILHQKLRFIGSINRQYDKRFANSGAKIGTSLQIRLPNEFTVRSGRTMNAEDITEAYTTLTVATQVGVDFQFDTADMTMTIDNFSERYLEPAATKLAAHLEADALSMYKDVYEEISDDGDTMSQVDVLEGAKILTDNLCPEDGRTLLLNTRDNVSLVNALTSTYNPTSNISSQFRNGKVASNFMGYEDVYSSSLMPTHTTGTDDGTGDYLTDIAAAEANGSATYPEAGGELNIDTGAGSFKQGDIIEIEGVYDVHPESKATRSRLKRFVVTANATPGAGGGSIFIYPGIVATGPKQNVSAAAADGKIIYKRESDASTGIGNAATYDISMGYHRDAFTFVTADLVMPKGVDMAAREVYDGISMRFIRDYQIGNDVLGCRFDILYGKKAMRPQLAVRYGH